MMGLRLLFLCAIALTVGCSPAKATRASAKPAAERQAPATPDLSAYRLGVGDRIRVEVFGESDLSLDAVVDQSGRINYPLLGGLQAQKRTARELQDDIRAGLAAGYLVNPDVRVIVVQYRAFYLTGQVHRPGAYPYVVGLTVEKALALGGGMTNLASTRSIYLLREDTSSRIHVGLSAVVLPGDTLLVEESLF